MGVQKDLEAAKKDLDVVSFYFEKPDVAWAKRVLQNVLKKIGEIVKAHEAKKKMAVEGLKKLNEAVKIVDDLLDKVPSKGPRRLRRLRRRPPPRPGPSKSQARECALSVPSRLFLRGRRSRLAPTLFRCDFSPYSFQKC